MSDGEEEVDQPTASGIGIVGIGASAGGLEPCMRLLENVPADTGLAFVVVQHLDPLHHSSLGEILGRCTKMRVEDAADGVAVQPDHVYVIPPNASLAIEAGTLRIGPRPQGGVHHPIDYFLRSLARECASRAIGVVLSGAGSDGALGLQAIKEAGGVTFVQEPATAEFPSMPEEAEAAASADFVLAPERIGTEIGRIAADPQFNGTDPALLETALAQGGLQFRSILAILHESSGIDFSLYRAKTVNRRILRRVALRNVKGLEEYAKLLRQEPGERNALQRDLLICVTSFFRDPESFEALQRLVFPAIVQDRPAGAPIRIWVPGCATGEEAYSIAIALHEFLRENALEFPIQIFASDISEAAVEKARGGRYPVNIEGDVGAERLGRYFLKVDSGYQISRQIRETCVFSRHNLIDDPPFSKLDLISCRNVLIYLGAVQKDIIPAFHYALKEHGFLILGRSETAHFEDLFSVVHHGLRIYAKRHTGRKAFAFRAPLGMRSAPVANSFETTALAAGMWDGVDIGRAVDRLLLTRFTPATVLVDENLDVLEVRGRVSPFLTLPTGKLSFHLLKLLPDMGLFLTVEKLIREALATGAPARQEGVAHQTGDRIREVSVEATPIRGNQRSAVLVLFESAPESGAAPAESPAEKSALEEARQHVAKLRHEMEELRQRLMALVEDHQISVEESQNATEEALSANEELQSLNEELETAKEELQSTNEELVTVNRELESRNSALTQARNFASAIVETVQIPLIVLDGALRVKAVNAAFTKTFGLPARQSEGQLIYSLGDGTWDIPGLRDRLERVLPTRHSFEGFAVEHAFPVVGNRALVINACRLDNLDMILVAVDDATERRDAERALRSSEEHLRQAQKMEAIGRLAGGIAHDFNNLLTAIIGYCHLIAETVADNHDAVIWAREAESAAGRAATLTDQLLTFSRRKILQPRIFDVNQLIGDFENMLRRLVDERIEIEMNTTAQACTVNADPGEIGRAVMNLCLNARDAMPVGGKIIISTSVAELSEASARARDLAPGSYVQLEIRDTGIGMDPAMQAHIFEPFFTTKDPGKGTGLGLATVLGIVQESGGAIWCDSEIGRGSRFTLLLPESQTRDVAPERPAGRLGLAPRGSQHVVLLVEDEDQVRALTRTVLEAQGYIVLEARNGKEGLATCQTHPGVIDLLLTDVVMPEMGGRELAERARELRPDMRVLYVSGHNQDVILREGIRSGAAFLQKPFSPVELAHKVSETLAAPN